MYYSVEIYPKHDIIIKDISDSEYQAVMEDNYLSLDRLVTYRTDGATVKTGRQIANYYTDRNKRNQFVYSLLESDSY
jgi:hypothetical protein